MNDLEREGTRIIARDLNEDPEAGSLHDQLKVFAREVGVLYSAERVRTPDELRAALRRSFARRDLPTLIEVPVGPMPSPCEFFRLPKVRGV